MFVPHFDVFCDMFNIGKFITQRGNTTLNFMWKINNEQIAKRWVRYQFFKWKEWNSRVGLCIFLESHSLLVKWRKSLVIYTCAYVSLLITPHFQDLQFRAEYLAWVTITYNNITLHRCTATWDLFSYWLVDSKAPRKLWDWIS